MQLTHSVLDGRCHPFILFHAQMMHKKRMRARVAKITQRGSAGGTDLGVVVQQQGDEDVAGIVLSGPAQPGNGARRTFLSRSCTSLTSSSSFPF